MGTCKELLVGCGARRQKILTPTGVGLAWRGLVTLDINESHHPDVTWDLANLPLPFEDECFDEIHAYEVLEHVGQQGDYKFFFAQFADFWRLLKPDGWLFGTVPEPNTAWVWGDPSHTRAILPESLIFLSQKMYKENVGQNPMSDFRHIYRADFELRFSQISNGLFLFGLQAVKPARLE